MRIRLSIFPAVCLLISSLGIAVLFPQFTEVEDWIWRGLGSVPLLAWYLAGVIIGVLIGFLYKRWPDRFRNYLRNVSLGILAWLGIAILATAFFEEGDLPTRISESPLLKAWAVMLFAIVSMMPTVLGTYTLLSGSRISTGGSVFFQLVIAASVIIFMQAKSNTFLDQDPLVSIVTIWAMIGFVEGISWRRMYGKTEGEEDARVVGGLFRRQVASSMIFLAIGTMIAYSSMILDLLGLLDSGPMNLYEIDTVYGWTAISFVFLVPLIVFTIYRRLMDIKGGKS